MGFSGANNQTVAKFYVNNKLIQQIDSTQVNSAQISGYALKSGDVAMVTLSNYEPNGGVISIAIDYHSAEIYTNSVGNIFNSTAPITWTYTCK